MYTGNVPVLFLVYNRLENTITTFEQIKIAKPRRIYIASDGAKNSDEDRKKVKEVREWILDNVDWQCDIRTMFRHDNAGCGVAVSSAITWFFSHESKGIILEDDCVPSQTFFSYCEELLDYYESDKRIWHIAGENPLGEWTCDESYYFTKIQLCWGWATWADRWKYYKYRIGTYNESVISNISRDKYVIHRWKNILGKVQREEVDTWDYQWTFAIIKHKGLCINPKVNLIKNIGEQGVHYSTKSNNDRMNRRIYDINSLLHPQEVVFDTNAQKEILRIVFKIYKIPLWRRIAHNIKSRMILCMY